MSDPGSLKAAEQEAALQARLTAREEKLAGLKASLSDRKRALLGKLVESRTGAAPSRATIPRRRPAGPSVLSFTQERLWYLDRLEPESPVPNVCAELELCGL